MTALYVRIPTPVATALDRMSSSTGRAKQQIVAEIFEGALDATRPGRGEAGPNGRAVGDVMTLEETAELLRVLPDGVMVAVNDDGLPARRVGGEWRFGRAAVLHWLADAGPATPSTTRAVAGFGARSSSKTTPASSGARSAR